MLAFMQLARVGRVDCDERLETNRRSIFSRTERIFGSGSFGVASDVIGGIGP